MNFRPGLNGLDVWIRPVTKIDGSDHCEHALFHVDDTLVVSENVEIVIRNEIGKCFDLKK